MQGSIAAIFCLAAGAAAASIAPEKRVPSLPFTSLVVFGDSFSDNGNGSYRISNGTVPANPAYFDHRFSNGPVWAEYLASNLSIPLLNYAIGGATTSNALVQGFTGATASVAVPAVLDQIGAFLGGQTPTGTTPFPAAYEQALQGPLFALFAGANDILFDINVTAAQSYAGLVQGMGKLLGAYPQGRVVALAPPDIAELPYGAFVGPAAKAQLRAWSDGLAELLARGASAAVPLGAEDDNEVVLVGRVASVDLRGLFGALDYYAEPQAYGFDPLGKYGSCVVGEYFETPNVTLCGDGELQGRVYWDEYHPTTKTHGWIAKEVLNVLSGPFA